MSSVRPRGFTLIELMLVIVILVVIIVIAVPSFVDTLERRKIVKATQALTGQIQQARSLAITRNRQVGILVRSDNPGSWCFGLTDDPAVLRGDLEDPDDLTSPPVNCNCGLDPAKSLCSVKVPSLADPNVLESIEVLADQTEFAGVGLAIAGNRAVVTFEPTRGLRRGAAAADTFDFESDRRGARLTTRVTVNAIGRITTCSPSGSQLPGGIGPC